MRFDPLGVMVPASDGSGVERLRYVGMGRGPHAACAAPFVRRQHSFLPRQAQRMQDAAEFISWINHETLIAHFD